MNEVHSPAHYTVGGIETIAVLKAKLSREEFRGYLKGNIIKYMSRAAYKGREQQDYAKAKWYLDYLCNWEKESDSETGSVRDAADASGSGGLHSVVPSCQGGFLPHADREA